MRNLTARLARVIGVIGLAAAAASGCALPDRETFAPEPALPGDAEARALPPAPGGPPLITVRFAAASPDFAQAVAAAIRAAEQRRPGRPYQVVLVTPSVAATVLETGSQDALAVARAMIAAGARPSGVALSGEVDRALPAREIRVFAGA